MTQDKLEEMIAKYVLDNYDCTGDWKPSKLFLDSKTYNEFTEQFRPKERFKLADEVEASESNAKLTRFNSSIESISLDIFEVNTDRVIIELV